MARRIFNGLPHFDAGFAGADGAQVEPCGHLDVALDGDILEMEAVLVRAGGHVVGALQAFVGINFYVGGNIDDRAERAGFGAEQRDEFPQAWPDARPRRRSWPANLVSFNWSSPRIRMMIGFAVGDVNQRLDLAVGGNAVGRLGQRLDGHDAGRGKFFDGRADFARGGFGNAAGGFFDVRRVTAGFAEGDFVLAGFGGDHEFVRIIAADDAGVRLHRKRLQAAARENARVGVIHFFVAGHGAFVRGVEANRRLS